MDNFLRDKNRDTVLFINEIANNQIDWVIEGLDEVSNRLGRKVKALVVTDRRDKVAAQMKLPKDFEQIVVNTSSILQLEAALLPYQDKLLTAVCRGERNIPYFKNIIPYIPYLRTPTSESLDWTMNKINMRRRLKTFNSKLSPKYWVAHDVEPDTIRAIKDKVGYPCIVKPANLAASALVSVCYHQEEVEAAVKKVLKKLKEVQKKRGYEKTDEGVLIEQFMEGTMYSVDVYVSSRGTCYPTPPAHIITGFMEGKGDFFGFKQMMPSLLKTESRKRAMDVAVQATKALGMRSITSHVELMKTSSGFKVIEVGPRVGGFRDFLYKESFGINHAANDILVRMPVKPEIHTRPKGYSAIMKIYAEEEGIIEKLVGLKVAQNLDSFKHLDIRFRAGDKAIFARHGGPSVLDVYLFNKERSDLLADMHRIETKLKIKIASKKSFEDQTPDYYEDQMSEDIVISK